jgi:hypothetical protein
VLRRDAAAHLVDELVHDAIEAAPVREEGRAVRVARRLEIEVDIAVAHVAESDDPQPGPFRLDATGRLGHELR